MNTKISGRFLIYSFILLTCCFLTYLLTTIHDQEYISKYQSVQDQQNCQASINKEIASCNAYWQNKLSIYTPRPQLHSTNCSTVGGYTNCMGF